MQISNKFDGIGRIFYSLLLSGIGAIFGLLLKIVISRNYESTAATNYFFLIDTINISMMFLASTKDPLIRKTVKIKDLATIYLFIYLILVIFATSFFFLLCNLSNIELGLHLYLNSSIGLLAFSILVFFSNWSLSKGHLHINERITAYQFLLILILAVLYLIFDSNQDQLNYLLFSYFASNIFISLWIIYKLSVINSLPYFSLEFKIKDSFIFFKEAILAVFEFLSVEGLFYTATLFVIIFYQSNNAKLTFQAVSKPIFLALVLIPGYAIYRTLLIKLVDFRRENSLIKVNNLIKFMNLFLLSSYIPIIVLIFYLENIINFIYSNKFLYNLFGLKVLLLSVPIFIFNYIISANLKSLNRHKYIFIIRFFTLLYFIASTYIFDIYLNSHDYFIELNLSFSSILTAILLLLTQKYINNYHLK